MRIVSLALPALLGGCALFSKGDAVYPRYFSPDPPPGSASPAPATSPLELRLGRVEAGRGLEESIAYRTSPVEVGYYDDRLWTEKPAVYVRRRLERVLFEERGLRRVVSGIAPTLDVELLAFEELRGPPLGARVTVRAVLRDDHAVLREETLTEERPATRTDANDEAPVVGALAAALDAVVHTIAAHVESDLAAHARPPAAAPQ